MKTEWVLAAAFTITSAVMIGLRSWWMAAIFGALAVAIALLASKPED